MGLIVDVLTTYHIAHLQSVCKKNHLKSYGIVVNIKQLLLKIYIKIIHLMYLKKNEINKVRFHPYINIYTSNITSMKK